MKDTEDLPNSLIGRALGPSICQQYRNSMWTGHFSPNHIYAVRRDQPVVFRICNRDAN